jgi:3-deoxy-D-manno-octulosonic-acid transferase
MRSAYSRFALAPDSPKRETRSNGRERIPMPYLLNLSYLLVLFLFSPWLIYKALTTGKYGRGLWSKLTGRLPSSLLTPLSSVPRVWFHGVSVGEIHLLGPVVAAFRKCHPNWSCVISTTTDTGYDEARKRFPDLPVFFWPLDFSWSVKRALRTVEPDLIVLAESEMWPNFVWAAKRQGVRLALLNGRMSPRSLRRFLKVRWLVRGLFSRLDLCAAQTDEYAAAFRAFGAGNVQVTGSVKYDGACTDRDNPRTRQIAALLGIGANDLIWVAGSTQTPEEEIVLDIFRRARADQPNLRLILVPRQKDRFEEVATLLTRSGIPFVRRSQLGHPVTPSRRHPVILVDTIGELGAVWGLADVAFVGGSLDGKRGGQNMIEPAAYGAAVVFGSHTWNFKETVARLLDHQAAIQVADAGALEHEVRRLLADPQVRATLGQAAQRLVQAQQGAVERTMRALDPLTQLDSRTTRAA